MRRRRYFVGLAALLMAASTVILAGPAGAITDGCQENMNPNGQGNASGLIVACTFANLTSAGTQLQILDYADPGHAGAADANHSTNQQVSGAVYHYGEARNVSVTVARAASSTAGASAIQTCASNTTAATAPGTTLCPGNASPTAAIVPAGNFAISTADVNHSIEFPTSSATMTGLFIRPGSFIKSVTGTSVVLSQGNMPTATTLAGGPLCPTSPGPATGNCAHSVPGTVLVSNGTNRVVTDGNTGHASNIITSLTAHFCAPTGSTCVQTAASGNSDIGDRVSGGSLPDGATIASLNSISSANLECSGCGLGFTSVTKAPDNGTVEPSCAPPNLPCGPIVLTIDPPVLGPVNPVAAPATGVVPTSARYVTNGTCTSGTKTLGSVDTSQAATNPGNGARFAKSDVGMEITFNPAIAALKGARILTVNAAGTSALLQSPANFGSAPPTGGTACKNFTIGKPTKTAPATSDVAGELAIELIVNPNLSPTSPPCAAAKVSGFEIPLLWKNPGAYSLPPASGTNYTSVIVSNASIAQLIFSTSATSFGGFLKQNYAVSGTSPNVVNGPSTYQISFEFLPVGAGLCTGTGIAETFHMLAISLKQAQNPSFTGGGGAGLRSMSPLADQGFTTYTGGTGANVTTKALNGANTFSGPNANACTLNSPNNIQLGCTGNIK